MRAWHINFFWYWGFVLGIAYHNGKESGLDRGFVTVWLGPLSFCFGPNGQLLPEEAHRRFWAGLEKDGLADKIVSCTVPRPGDKL